MAEPKWTPGPWRIRMPHGYAHCVDSEHAAQREEVAIVGGEMAQMRDTYAPGYIGVVVYVTGIKQ